MHRMSKSINSSVDDAAAISDVLREKGDSDPSALRVRF